MTKTWSPCFVILLWIQLWSTASADEEKLQVRIAGYLPDYRINSVENETIALLDDVYLFSLSPQIQLGDNMFQACCLQSSHYEILESMQKGPKYWVTVGGAGRSNKLTRAPSAMMRALAKLVLEDHSFITGIDFDCELFLEHSDYENYDKLVTAATNIFPAQGISVSIALHPGQHTSVPSAIQKVDRINLMTYEMPTASYHADYTKMRSAVEDLIQAGVSSSKIFIGMPCYGKHKTTGEAKAYHELAEKLSDDPVKRHKKYAYGDFLVESPAAIQAKVRFAQKSDLGGVFFWEIGQDKDRILLTAAAKQVGKAIPEEELKEKKSHAETTSCTNSQPTLNSKASEDGRHKNEKASHDEL